jgi:hypothetical protein
MITRTPVIEIDQPFAVDVEITKAFVDRATGRRTIIGVASGGAEDRDGERVSANAIKSMVRQLESGAGIKLTTGHQQDWMTEIGDVVQATHDPKSDELIVKTELPPEGIDAIADKAWRTSQTEKLAFSIGGKLRGAYFERNELGKKRKVLDAIQWRHVALTKHPSYANSFAQAVAKTWDGEAPDDDAFTEAFDPDSVAKDSTTGSWVGGDSDAGGGNVGRDSVGSGKRNAGTHKPGEKGQNTDSADDDLPDTPDERHLSCPQCGHEFAADLPVDASERQGDPSTDKDSDTGKTAEREGLMKTLTETLDALKVLAAADDVEKTTPEPTAAAATTEAPAETTPAVDVAKTPAEESPDVAKLVAASHKHSEERFDRFETAVGEAFELVAKSHKQIAEMIADMPQGRKSVARILPKPSGHEADVEKTTEQLVAEADDPIAALKVLNEATYGIH